MPATEYAPINVDHLNHFLTSTLSVFRMMLGSELKRGKLQMRTSDRAWHEVSGVIGLSGKGMGTVVLGLDREVAIRATEAMTGEAPEGINADVVDVVGELTNMIAGAAKSQLEHLAMSISLPSVITGNAHNVSFPPGVTPICIPFESEWGKLCVEVGLVEKTGE